MVMLLTNVITHMCRYVNKKSVIFPDINKNQNLWAHSKCKFSRKSIAKGTVLSCGQTDRQQCGQTNVTGQGEQKFANVYLNAV